MGHLRRHKGMFLSAFVLVVTLSFLAGVFWLDVRALAKQRQENRLFVCEQIETLKTVQRNVLAEDIAETRNFLRKNPGGIPGIPADLIQRGIARDEAAVARLAPIPGGCTEFALLR